MSSGALQPVRLAAQLPKYTPLPRPDGLVVSNLGDAPQGDQAADGPAVMVNYKTKTGMDTWYSDRKATSQDCDFLCQQDADCLESSFDSALAACSFFGKPPSPAEHAPSPTPLPSGSAASAAEGLARRVVTLETPKSPEVTKVAQISKAATQLESAKRTPGPLHVLKDAKDAEAEAKAKNAEATEAEDPSLWGMLARAFDDITTAGPMAKAKAEAKAECKVCSGDEHLDEMLNCCLMTRNNVIPGAYGQRELPEDNRTATKNTGLPPLVVIGFQKAGTTYLRYLLSAHPELRTTCGRSKFGNEPSEVHYFDRLTQSEVLGHIRNGSSGRVELRNEYVEALSKKCSKKVMKKPITFDVTPGYSRLTPNAIKLVNMTLPPHTQFLALLRDPLELKKSRRVMHACIRGTPHNNCTMTEDSPDDAIWTDKFAIHLEMWRNVVGRHRLKTVLFDRLVDEPLETLNNVLDMVRRCLNAHQCAKAPPLHQCTIAPLRRCTNAQLRQCTNPPIHQSTNAPLPHRTNAPMQAGVSRMTALPDARKRPRQEEECQYKECGEVNDEVIAHYNEPAVCNPLREQARADLDALKEKLGIVTPSRWAKFCGSNHEGVTPYAAGAYKSYTKQPPNHGANLEQRRLSTDNSIEGERERMRIS